MSYVLKAGVHLTEGALNGAIIDSNTGNVFSVNPSALAIIRDGESTSPFWQTLMSLGLAETYEEQQGGTTGQAEHDLHLRFVWFELVSQACNEHCIHCYVGSKPGTSLPSRKYHAHGERVSTRLAYEEWVSLIRSVKLLGCTACQFIGGEPFLYRDEGRGVLDLAGIAISAGYDFVEIYTNATLLDQTKIAQISKLGLNLAVSLYSHDEAVHDSITRVQGSFTKTVSALALAREYNIPTRVEVIAMQRNERGLPQTLEFIRELGFPVSNPDPIRPTGRGTNASLQAGPETLVKYGCLAKPDFHVEGDTVTKQQAYHSCLAGKLAILENGDILPCVFSRNHAIGNVRQVSLEELVGSQGLQEYWHLSKDDVLVCQDCEYRYVCFDCRALAESCANGFASYHDAPYPRCSYNPYTGEWAGGLWRMTESGPVYDRSYAVYFTDSSVQSK